jgi:hypothetical protein
MLVVTMPWWKSVVAVVVVLTSGGAACAQDRPLLEPLRLGYTRADPIAERLRDAASLEGALPRKGFVPVWREFGDGLGAIRSLDADEIDLALVIPLNAVIAAKRENLKMVFIAELRSIAPTCCDMDELYADHMFKRYTLSSEYLADHRENILLILHQEINKVLQLRADAPHSTSHGFVSPGSMRGGGLTNGARSRAAQIDDTAEIADVNYWGPRQH